MNERQMTHFVGDDCAGGHREALCEYVVEVSEVWDDVAGGLARQNPPRRCGRPATDQRHLCEYVDDHDPLPTCHRFQEPAPASLAVEEKTP